MPGSDLYAPAVFETFDPIIGEQPISGAGRLRAIIAGEREAIALYRGSLMNRVIGPGQRLTAGEVVWGGFERSVHVTLATRPCGFALALPGHNQAFVFRARVTVECAVADVQAVVQTPIRDAARALQAPVEDRLRRAVRDARAGDLAAAQDQASQSLRSGERIGAFRIEATYVQLDLESSIVDVRRAAVVASELAAEFVKSPEHLLALATALPPDARAPVMMLLNDVRARRQEGEVFRQEVTRRLLALAEQGKFDGYDLSHLLEGLRSGAPIEGPAGAQGSPKVGRRS